MKGTVVVFARRPDAGQVKTRIGRVLGDEAALALHEAFLADTLETARATANHVVLARTPGPVCPEDAMADEVVIQQGGTFAERFDGVLAGRTGPMVLIGSDTPHLQAAAIAAAFIALEDADMVVGPAPRGGFHLLAFRDTAIPVGSVFEEQDEVAALHALADQAGMHCTIVAECRDLDEVADLHALAASDPVPEHTRAALTRWLSDAKESTWTERHTGS